MLPPLRAGLVLHEPGRRGQGSPVVSVSTEGAILIQERSVLIVDRSEETREVLKTALERRGVRTFSASRAERGIELAREYQPDLIVLDLEVDGSAADEVCAPFAEHAQGHHTPMVILGNLQCATAGSEAGQAGEVVSKPYHYGPLIRKIEELLSVSGRTCVRSV